MSLSTRLFCLTLAISLISCGGGDSRSSPTESAVLNASFTYAAWSAVGSTVQFRDASTGNPTRWSWNFGDPTSGARNTSTLQNPTHIYSTAATYVVTLTVSNARGSSVPASGTLSVGVGSPWDY